MGRIKKRTFEKIASRFGYEYKTCASYVYLFKDGKTSKGLLGFTKAYHYIYEIHRKKAKEEVV